MVGYWFTELQPSLVYVEITICWLESIDDFLVCFHDTIIHGNLTGISHALPLRLTMFTPILQ